MTYTITAYEKKLNWLFTQFYAQSTAKSSQLEVWYCLILLFAVHVMYNLSDIVQ